MEFEYITLLRIFECAFWVADAKKGVKGVQDSWS